MATTQSPTPKKRHWGRRILIGFGVLLLVLTVAVGVLLALKPWAPKIQVADPEASGRRVAEAGVLGNYYPGAGGKRPTVLVIGGSEGGLNRGVDRTAVALQKQGYTALALSYWGGEGQPQAIESLPLETFGGALDWLSRQPEVDANKLAMIGTSKGGEATVLMASREPRLKAAVGYVPSHVVWRGFDLREPWRMGSIGSSWSADGRDLPYLPYTDQFRGGPLVTLYEMSLTSLDKHPEAIIEVEKGKAPLLLVCGEDDQMWPSCPMSREVKKRAEAKGGPAVTVLAYPEAGHLLTGPPVEAGAPIDLTQLGGTQSGMQRAYEDSWPQVLSFLATSLR